MTSLKKKDYNSNCSKKALTLIHNYALFMSILSFNGLFIPLSPYSGKAKNNSTIHTIGRRNPHCPKLRWLEKARDSIRRRSINQFVRKVKP